MDGVFMRIKKFLKKIYAIQFKELRLYFGKTNKKIKYVIRFFPREGLMSMLYKACGHVEYALRKGYVPVVDIEHFRTVYKACTWSDFFELRIQDKDVEDCSYIISSAGAPKDSPPLFGRYWAYAFDDFAKKGVWFWQHFSINKDIMQVVEKEAAQLNIERCIGLLLRGTDYLSLKPEGHPKQPDLEDIYSVIDDYLTETQADIFLVTEDLNIRNHIAERYGKRIKTVPDDIYVQDYKEGHMLADTISKNSAYQNAVVYEKKIVLLSMCRYLIASKTNGSLMALIMNAGKYEKTYIFDRGMYE